MVGSLVCIHLIWGKGQRGSFFSMELEGCPYGMLDRISMGPGLGSFQWNSKVARMEFLTGYQWGLDLDLATHNDKSINDKTYA